MLIFRGKQIHTKQQKHVLIMTALWSLPRYVQFPSSVPKREICTTHQNVVIDGISKNVYRNKSFTYGEISFS